MRHGSVDEVVFTINGHGQDMNRQVLIAAVVVMLAMQGCGRSKPIPEFEMLVPVPVGWRMTPEEAVLAATSYCEGLGMTDHIRQGPPALIVDEFEGQRYWSLGYHKNSKMPGDHFGLLINDATGMIEYEPGE